MTAALSDTVTPSKPGPFPLRHYDEHAHLLSNIENLKPPLPIWGSMLPFWNPTGVFPRSVTPHCT